MHAYVFHGPTGVGKAAAARQLARRLNCARGGDDGCAVCRQIDVGTFPNLIVVAPLDKPSIGIDQIRELGQMLALQPYVSSGRRVVIIESAEAMTIPAQNALLKFIEEPPPATLLLLVAPSLQALLPTVVSRLGVVYFLPVAAGELAVWLKDVRHASSVDAALIAEQAEGRVGVAVAIMEAGGQASDSSRAATKLIKGSVFDRLTEAARLAAAKADIGAVADSIHAAALQGLKDESIRPQTAGNIMAAAERTKHYLGANVTARSALERFVLEVA